jgi:hypothetical protein
MTQRPADGPVVCARCGGQISVRARVCLGCGAPHDPVTPSRIDAAGPTWVDAVTHRHEPAPIPSVPEWVDTHHRPERGSGAPEPRPHARVRGPLGAFTGQVTQVGEPRSERVMRPLLVVTLLIALAGLALAVAFLRLVLRVVIALFTRSPAYLLVGGGSSLTTFVGPIMGLSGQMIPVLPFRVVTGDGRVVDCVLRGTIWGGAVGLGDSVVVSGVWALAGGATLDVRRVRNRTTGAVTRARLPFGKLRGGYDTVVSLIVVAAIAFLVYRACQG